MADQCIEAGERVAVFDLGSNTARGLLAHVRPDGVAEVLDEGYLMTSLGKGLSTTGRLYAEGLTATIVFVRAALTAWDEPDCVFAVATAAARDAVNAHELLFRLRAETGVCAEIIDGAEEGRLSFLGALAMAPQFAGSAPAVVDVGGRSTEVIRHQGAKLVSTSVPVGARSLTEGCLLSDPPTSAEIGEARRVVRDSLSSALSPLEERPVIVVGGSAQTAMLLAAGARVLALSELERLAGHLCSVALAQRRSLIPFDPARAEVICGGLVILEAIAAQAPARRVHISLGGVREGLLLERTGATRLVY